MVWLPNCLLVCLLLPFWLSLHSLADDIVANIFFLEVDIFLSWRTGFIRLRSDRFGHLVTIESVNLILSIELSHFLRSVRVVIFNSVSRLVHFVQIDNSSDTVAVLSSSLFFSRINLNVVYLNTLLVLDCLLLIQSLLFFLQSLCKVFMGLHLRQEPFLVDSLPRRQIACDYSLLSIALVERRSHVWRVHLHVVQDLLNLLDVLLRRRVFNLVFGRTMRDFLRYLKMSVGFVVKVRCWSFVIPLVEIHRRGQKIVIWTCLVVHECEGCLWQMLLKLRGQRVMRF